MLVEELNIHANNKELISVERDCHDEELTGYILKADDNLVLMTLVDCDGIFEGFSVFKTDQITEVFWGNREHQALSILSSSVPSLPPPSFESSELEDIIIEASQEFSSVCLHSSHDEDNFDIAEIEAHDEEWLKIYTFGVKRTLSRMKKLMKIDAISRVVVDSPYQNGIVELHSKGL